MSCYENNGHSIPVAAWVKCKIWRHSNSADFFSQFAQALPRKRHETFYLVRYGHTINMKLACGLWTIISPESCKSSRESYSLGVYLYSQSNLLKTNFFSSAYQYE